jgi:hypothetical protein
MAARKATTPVILYVDDDVSTPQGVPEKLVGYFSDPSVVAVSTQAYEQDKHWLAYRAALYDLYPNHHNKKGNFDNRLYLIRRDFAASYRPLGCFYCEDALLNQDVRKVGKWVHLPYMGVKHYSHSKNLANWGYAAQQLRLDMKSPLLSLPGKLLVSYIAFLRTLDPRTLHYGARCAVQWFAGWVMAKLDGY